MGGEKRRKKARAEPGLCSASPINQKKKAQFF
jgi:hypothetical protein